MISNRLNRRVPPRRAQFEVGVSVAIIFLKWASEVLVLNQLPHPAEKDKFRRRVLIDDHRSMRRDLRISSRVNQPSPLRR